MGKARKGANHHNWKGGWNPGPLYAVWSAMRQRCENPRCASYPAYGGRGISVCDRWQSFETFAADMGERPSGTSLDRIDVNGNYEPSNCRWATDEVQARNKRRRSPATHCKRNHELTPDNVYTKSDGRRQCKRCNRDRLAA